MKKTIFNTLAIAALLVSSASAATIVDVVIVMDESGSMSGEQSWIKGVATSLETKLGVLGYSPNFSVIGFGSSANVNGRTLLAGGNAAAVNLVNFVTSGGTEDGYTGLKYASLNGNFTAGAARNYILVTDEDRDVSVAANTLASTAALLSDENALLNAIINNRFSCGGATPNNLGRTTSKGYNAGALGTFTTCNTPATGSGRNNTTADYVNLALNSGGATWDILKLRGGGNDAAAFTAAFVDIKVQEIIIQTGIPEPGTYAMMATGLIGLAYFRRKK